MQYKIIRISLISVLIILVLIPFTAYLHYSEEIEYIQRTSYYKYYFNSSIKKNENKDLFIDSSEYLFIGDSRFVGMSKYKTDKDTFICEVGQGYNYFISNINSYNNLDKTIIIGFGVNDLYNIEKYTNYVNNLNSNINIYFLTVNPVDEQKEKQYGYTVTNKDIINFNEKLKEKAINYKIIDTYKYLIENGYETTDGLHYNNETYKKIYEYIKENT